MNDTSTHGLLVGAETQAKTKEAAAGALQALDSLHRVSPDAAGLVARAAATYFDGISKIALLSQAALLKEMTGNIVDKSLQQAAEDALDTLATDIFMGAAAAIAAAAGAAEAEAASFAIDKIDQSIGKYSALLHGRAG